MLDEIVDAHMHLWDLQKISYPWLTPPLPVGITGDVSPIAQSYGLDDYLRDASGARDIHVRKIVHIEAGAAASASLDETRWLESIAQARGYPQAIIASAQLESPDVEALLAQQASHPHVRGIRQILNWHPDPLKTYTPRDLLADPAWERGFALLARHGFSFDLQIYPAQMPAAAALAGRHPDIPLILNHTGMPVDRGAAGLEAWQEGMRGLAQHPNVFVKISGLAMLDWSWSLESLRPFVLGTIDTFGPERCLFGSNFPVDRLFGSFERYYEAYLSLLAGMSATERARMLATNAERIYRI